MSKLGCTCGHSVRDQTDRLPYKGYILKDEDREAVLEGIAFDIASYIESLLEENKKAWIDRFPWLQDAEHDAVVWDIITRYRLKYPVHLYECESCGRLWIQQHVKSEKFLSYVPEHPEARGVLRSKQSNQAD